ncbi:hypothetical protein QE152_g29137 [Popillia japonica]|uniref:Uncharacterized protein n=1 Tax=Popillia japonica TaxID=7064 RepID=A0AAW1JIF4_POPJA
MDEVVRTEDHDIEIRIEHENYTVEVNDSEDEEDKEDKVNDQVPVSIKSYEANCPFETFCKRRLYNISILKKI